ncbi:MAG TPA: YitT family protein [Eubacterium sp.]|nr:YitT family protein [Eubacterium sp.]HAZ86659.1 YitT family protein [Eubacterium sp.]
MKKRLNYKDIAKETVILTVAVAIIAAAVYFFLVPSHTSVSSISGLGIVLSNFVPLPLSAITMFLNVVLLIIGFFTCGREFGVKTVYTSVMLPLFLGFFELVFPNFGSMTDSQELDVLCYILVVSIGLSILFNRNASSGGLDIVAKIMNKYLHIELGKAMSLSGMCVALSAALAYDKKTVVLSILGTYFNGIILDHFIFDDNKKRRVCIITRKEEELRRFIVEDLHSGATIYEATGAYNFDKHNEIITIVDKSEYQKLMNFINKEDPRAFITVYNVSDMRYQPKVWNKDGFQ